MDQVRGLGSASQPAVTITSRMRNAAASFLLCLLRPPPRSVFRRRSSMRAKLRRLSLRRNHADLEAEDGKSRDISAGR